MSEVNKNPFLNPQPSKAEEQKKAESLQGTPSSEPVPSEPDPAPSAPVAEQGESPAVRRGLPVPGGGRAPASGFPARGGAQSGFPPSSGRRVVQPPSARAPLSPGVPSPSSSGESVPSSVPSSSSGERRAGFPSSSSVGGKRERPQVVMPPGSGLKRKPFLSASERERLGDKPAAVVMPPGSGLMEEGESVSDRVASSVPGEEKEPVVTEGIVSSVASVEESVSSSGGSVKPRERKSRKGSAGKSVGRSAPVPRAEGLAEVDEEWGEDEAGEPVEESYRDTVLEKAGSAGVRIMERDVRIFRFLGRYRYAQASQVARLVGTSDAAAWIRMTKLEGAGLVRRNEIVRGHTVWSPLKGGMAIAELDFPVVASGRISLTTMGHELGLVNLGVELENGGHNVLRQDGWPFHNKYSVDGSFEDDELLVGENVFTTREIRSSQQRWSTDKSSAQVRGERDRLLESWNPGERSPETLPENAGAFVLYSLDYKDHVPDMVVARDRSLEGFGQSIALELELSAKPLDEWRRILKNYRDYIQSGLFHSVFYFTQRTAIKDSLVKLNKEEIGIPEDRFRILRYVSRNKQLIWG